MAKRLAEPPPGGNGRVCHSHGRKSLFHVHQATVVGALWLLHASLKGGHVLLVLLGGYRVDAICRAHYHWIDREYEDRGIPSAHPQLVVHGRGHYDPMVTFVEQWILLGKIFFMCGY